MHYSLVYLPEAESDGQWVEVNGECVKCGPDDLSRPAGAVLSDMPPWNERRQTDAKGIYLIGFQQWDGERARNVTDTGLSGFAPDDMPGSIYPLMATGAFAGSLIHTPNVYDFPVSLQIARAYGGDAVWVADGRPVDFSEMWNDERADMLRLPGIVATSHDSAVLSMLCELARDWDPQRYPD